ncbi:hypothetical protein G6F68_021054 [Rhizopus microsporus]|nr:hypothetical protein G6F68_021054 [Rhizopus microsporus]
MNVFHADTGTQIGLFKSSDNGTHSGLRGHTGHGVNGNINNVSTSSGSSHHASNTSTCSIVCVNVNGQVRELGTDTGDQ